MQHFKQWASIDKVTERERDSRCNYRWSPWGSIAQKGTKNAGAQRRFANNRAICAIESWRLERARERKFSLEARRIGLPVQNRESEKDVSRDERCETAVRR